MPRIFYLAPDFDVPSWGVGLLYHHVRLLLGLGYEAAVLHQEEPFRLSWLTVDVPIRYLSSGDLALTSEDILVVPEVLARAAVLDGLECRRVVFVQNGFLLFADSDTATDYPDEGYEAAMVTMPHLSRVVADHCGLEPALVPPFVAPYFFVGDRDLDRPRRREVLIFKKAQYGQAGYPDHDIAVKLLRRRFSRLGQGSGTEPWQLVELAGRTHLETARAMKRAAFFVALNTLEGFNVSVAEAMAAGCVPLCYEAVGGRDYLRDGENAYVFTNNHVYSLVETLFELTESYEARSEELGAMRRRALVTAEGYREAATAEALRRFFAGLT